MPDTNTTSGSLTKIRIGMGLFSAFFAIFIYVNHKFFSESSAKSGNIPIIELSEMVKAAVSIENCAIPEQDIVVYCTIRSKVNFTIVPHALNSLGYDKNGVRLSSNPVPLHSLAPGESSREPIGDIVNNTEGTRIHRFFISERN